MLRKNTAGQYIAFGLVNATTGAALTGATVTARRSIDGAAQATATGTVSELGNGQYVLALSQADTNGDSIGYAFSATSAIPVFVTAITSANLLTDIWAAASRTLTAFAFSVTASSVTDKTGYSLSTAPPTAAQIRTELDSNSTKLANLDTNVGSRMATFTYTAPDSADTIADAVLKRDWTAVTGEASRSVLNALRALRNKVTRAGVVYKENDSTPAWTFTTTEDATAAPLTEIDPS